MSDQSEVETAFSDGRLSILVDEERNLNPHLSFVACPPKWDGRGALVHVISKPAGGEIRGYVRIGNVIHLRLPNYAGEWPDLDAAVEKRLGVRIATTVAERLFMGIFPTGISYADRSRERNGDYLTLARLPFRTLELEWTGATCPDDLRAAIEADAKRMQARRGEEFQVSTAGQTVLLGDKPHE